MTVIEKMTKEKVVEIARKLELKMSIDLFEVLQQWTECLISETAITTETRMLNMKHLIANNDYDEGYRWWNKDVKD